MELGQTAAREPNVSPRSSFRARPAFFLLFWALVFAVAHTQSPLFFSNQNQYFLHGMAAGGVGFLDEDWLARTADPTPVFSALVAATYRHLSEQLFYVYYAIILGLYFWSLMSLGAVIMGHPPTGLVRLGLFTAFIALHAAAPRLASAYLCGKDYPWYFQCGIANQYVLGPGLQPSVFGVLLITSIAAFVRGRLVLAILCSSAAATVHATYLLPAAMLTLAYIIQLARDRRGRAAALLGAGSLLAVLPVVAYQVWTFAPSSAGEFAEAQRLLVEVRIPHHTIVRQWCDPVAIGQIGWMILGLALSWRTRLFPIYLTLGALSPLLTLVQVETGNHTLALLFPWRISSVLVPIATAVILARLFAVLTPWLVWRAGWQKRGLWVASAAVLVALVAGGVAINDYGLGYRMNTEELPLLDYVRTHKRAGDVYLLPVSISKVASGKGSISTSFMPPPRIRKDKSLIPVDLQRFRLITGAPVFVDFKSIPYRDVEVIEWYQRLLLVQDWYGRGNWHRPEIREALTRHGITHIVATANHAITGDDFEMVYADDSYRVYRVPRAGD